MAVFIDTKHPSRCQGVDFAASAPQEPAEGPFPARRGTWAEPLVNALRGQNLDLARHLRPAQRREYPVQV